MNEFTHIWFEEIKYEDETHEQFGVCVHLVKPSMPDACIATKRSNTMATRKWIAADGTQHDSAGAADEHDEVAAFVNRMIAGGIVEDAEAGVTVYNYFAATFRLPKQRAPRAAKPAVIAHSNGHDASAVKGKGKGKAAVQ